MAYSRVLAGAPNSGKGEHLIGTQLTCIERRQNSAINIYCTCGMELPEYSFADLKIKQESYCEELSKSIFQVS